jgi:hypothetical protein
MLQTTITMAPHPTLHQGLNNRFILKALQSAAEHESQRATKPQIEKQKNIIYTKTYFRYREEI